MTLKEKVYMGLATIAFIGFIGPIATTVVMREARIERLEESNKELQGFKEELVRRYIEYLEEQP